MSLHPTIARVTARIRAPSEDVRGAYLERMSRATLAQGPARAHLACGNQAHAYAAMGEDKAALRPSGRPISASLRPTTTCSRPTALRGLSRPEIARAARGGRAGATAQVAGGVPAMCDGVTQGQPGMELSLFSRDVSRARRRGGDEPQRFDAALYLGVCDRDRAGPHHGGRDLRAWSSVFVRPAR